MVQRGGTYDVLDGQVGQVSSGRRFVHSYITTAFSLSFRFPAIPGTSTTSRQDWSSSYHDTATSRYLAIHRVYRRHELFGEPLAAAQGGDVSEAKGGSTGMYRMYV